MSRRAWIIGGAVAGIALIACCGLTIGKLAGIIEALPEPSTSPVVVAATTGAPAPEPARTSAAAVKQLTARQVMDAIAAKWPAPNVRDNTGYAKDAGCVQAISSDTVTVLQFATEAQAIKWVAAGKGVADVRRVGVVVLSWAKKSDQDLTSEEARADMVKIAQALL